MINAVLKFPPNFVYIVQICTKEEGKTHSVSPPNVQYFLTFTQSQSSLDNKDDINHSLGTVYSSHNFSHLMFIWTCFNVIFPWTSLKTLDLKLAKYLSFSYTGYRCIPTGNSSCMIFMRWMPQRIVLVIDVWNAPLT